MSLAGGTNREDLQPAWLLHRRDYRDSSQIVEVLGSEHGRIGLVAQGVRRANSRLRGVLEPFQPLLLSWRGRGELQTLTGAERQQTLPRLSGDALMAGFYINELLLRLLARHDPHPGVFASYGEAIQALVSESRVGVGLRRFEWQLLDELGVAPDLGHEVDNGDPVQPGCWYRLDPEMGVFALAGPTGGVRDAPGEVLLAIAGDSLDNVDDERLRQAGRLLRQLLEWRLDGRPLKTRQVLTAMRRGSAAAQRQGKG